MKTNETKQNLKNELINSTSLTVNQSDEAVEAIIQALKNSVKRGKPVQIRGFGTLKPIVRPPQKARDIRRGKVIHIPAKKTVKFKPSSKFLDWLNV